MNARLGASELETMPIVIVGHVDHGKSTLVGRLIYDTGSLPDGKIDAIKQMCAKRGMPFEWSFLMDALQTERDQGITLDTSHIWFRTATRRYEIIDAPGHKEFLKNMVTGAAAAEAALLVIDAEEGVQEQSRRHGYLLHLLGLDQVAVVVNKMDLVGYDQARFEAIRQEYTAYLKSLGVVPAHFIPISAREGDGVVSLSARMEWYAGKTAVEALEGFHAAPSAAKAPLRFTVQDVYKFDARRIIAGRVESGTLRQGERLLFLPSGEEAEVQSIEVWPDGDAPESVEAGNPAGITLSKPIFVERGQVASALTHAPVITHRFRARLFWLARSPLIASQWLMLRVGTARYQVQVERLIEVVDTETLASAGDSFIPRGGIGEVQFRVRGQAALDAFATMRQTGRFVLALGHEVVGGGIVLGAGLIDERVGRLHAVSANLTAVATAVTPEQRAQHNGHIGGVLWFTGLSGSGKSTLAVELEKRLFAKGYQVMVLDGDNIRRGLNADLGFTPEDRRENIRRVGETAALLAQAGLIVITAFISPYREDRRRARAAAPDRFHSVYIKADVDTCELRDVKGLYQKARAGLIENFTGISAPYEAPTSPDLVVDTAILPIEASVSALLEYVEAQLVAPARVSIGA